MKAFYWVGTRLSACHQKTAFEFVCNSTAEVKTQLHEALKNKVVWN